ncbi:uncharacterized protein LOC133660008 isoform X2 [Entelurus aequoreus]|uniref:uncharacterized protein LOC133660008 isoform X2 n=1 Tax=Entelurus aequoreus TaxID=161455 RepID=UPI002B1D3B7A|nr:uncharacterized protein LOC133660008 isoform X2 [Entelurus aequoreus]
MKETFVSDASMIFTIPIGSDTEGCGHVMPREFQCVFQDTFKVFANRGFPKPLAAAQCLIGVSVVSLGVMFYLTQSMFHIFPSIVFVLSGMLSYAAGHAPDMRVMKLSFFLNIISFLWSVVATCLLVIDILYNRIYDDVQLHVAVGAMILSLLVAESFTALFLIYWQSKAVCRQHLNTLPIIQLTHED